MTVIDKPPYIACFVGYDSPIMRANEFAELAAFIAVAEELSFRRAAARLNLTPSTLSHTLRALEKRLGVRLLNRTTRTVSPTDAGRALLETITPAFATIESAIEDVNAFRAKPHGTVRLNVPLMAATNVLAPIFGAFARDYPDVILEVAVNDGFVDIVKQGFDAGIRLGERLEQDMTAVRVTRDMRIAIVGAPEYFVRHTPPATPYELVRHSCIGYRQITSGVLYRWEFEEEGKSFSVPVTGPLVLDSLDLMIAAAVDGVGLAHTPESAVADQLASGALVRVLDTWCTSFPGFYLYYPGRRQTSAALRALVDTLRLDD